MSRLGIQKTLKMYVGGEFVRSESGRTLPIRSRSGEVMHVSRASRKDLRDTIEKMRAAQPGWWKRTAYNRGQILYRLAEILEDRGDSLPTSTEDRLAAVDRAVHFAGWTDKISALLSSLNPVGQAFVNYSMLGPVGLVVAVPHPKDGLLGMIEAIGAALATGNSVTLFVDGENAPLAIALSEALATSDVPAAIVNILTGDLAELLAAANLQDDLDALYLVKGSLSAELRKAIDEKGAQVMRRILEVESTERPASPHQLAKLMEVKTVWMST